MTPTDDRAPAREDVGIPVTAEDVAALLDSARRTADELRDHQEDSALRGYFLRVAGLLVAMRHALRAEHERVREAEGALEQMRQAHDYWHDAFRRGTSAPARARDEGREG